MFRTYVDTCVLRLAFLAEDDQVSIIAVQELDKEDVTFLYSKVTELELLPVPTKNRKTLEIEFYKSFFDSAEFISCNDEAQEIAFEQACRFSMSAADALHVGCAKIGNADELLTAELITKPLPQSDAVSVRTIRV